MYLSKWLCGALISCAIFAGGCSKAPTSDIKTQAVADESVKFSAYESYAWFAGIGIVRDETGRWDDGDLDITAELKFLIDRTLRDRGLTEASTSPSLFVGFLVAADVNQLEEVKARGAKVASLEGTGESALVIELIDAETGHTVWPGVASADVQTGRTNDEVKARLDYAVTKLFDQLPRD